MPRSPRPTTSCKASDTWSCAFPSACDMAQAASQSRLLAAIGEQFAEIALGVGVATGVVEGLRELELEQPIGVIEFNGVLQEGHSFVQFIGGAQGLGQPCQKLGVGRRISQRLVADVQKQFATA